MGHLFFDTVIEIDGESYRGVLYIPDLTMRPADVADIVHRMSSHYPQSQVHGLERIIVTTETGYTLLSAKRP